MRSDHQSLKSLALLAAAALVAAPTVQAETITFQGGNLDTPANWLAEDNVTTGKPGSGDLGIINVNGTLNIGNSVINWDFAGKPEVVVGSGAVITTGGDWAHAQLASSTVNDATLNVGDDIFANGSTMTFNAGSVTDVNDDFEANGLSVLNINGGTHVTGDTFGAQGNNGTTFGTVNLTGGDITAGQFRVAIFGFMNLGGSTVLSGDGDTSLLEGTIDITSDWTGSWTISTLTGTDWETALTAGNWTFDSVGIDGTVFTNNFEVTNGGTTLALISAPTPPLLQGTSPGDGDTDVIVSTNLVASFDEDIALGATGTVTIKNLSNPADIVITLPGPDGDGTLSVSGNELTIDPAVDFAPGDEYAIEISDTAVEDLDGNPYAGILATDDPNWSFTTDATPPALVATGPIDDTSNVVVSTDLVATFDEDIALGATGTVTIKNLTNPADIVITLPGPDANGTLSVLGKVLTIDPTADLAAGDEFAIEISDTAIENLSGTAYPGILSTDVPNWSFTTDGTPPVLAATAPIDDTSNVVVSTDLVATFDEAIALGATGTVTIKNLSNPADIVITLPGPDANGTLSVLGNVLTIDPTADLAAGDEFAIEISDTAIEDSSGNAYAGIISADIPNWSFTTDGTPPSDPAMGPMAGATEVAVFSDLTLSFSEDVQIGAGTITIHLASDGSVVEAIDVNSGSVTIIGGEVSINPSSDLASGTAYSVTITDGAFTDFSGNTYAGIADDTTWTFTTESGDKILFADSFNRPDSSDLNASASGKSGALGTLDWVEVVNLADPTILGNEFKFGENGAGGGWSVAYLDHNFTDAAISAGAGFKVSVDLVNATSTGSTRFMGIVVGHSKSELDAWSSNNPVSNPFDSDFFIGIDPTGTAELKIFTNGTEAFQTGFTLTPTQTLNVEFSSITDFNAGSPVSYEAFIDGTSIHTGTFTWSGTNENYLGLYSNYTANQAIMDNFVVRSNVAILNPLNLEISQVGSNLEFKWNSMSGMQYDLVSSTDLSTPVANWLPYSDGMTIHENILSTGTGPQTLPGVLKVGARRFFALIEEEIPPLLLEGFETDGGGFTTTGTPNDWQWGIPNSDNQVDLVLDSSNSTNCWGTNLGDDMDDDGFIDTAANSILRSPDINMTNVTGAQLQFAAAIDAVDGDTFEVLVREVGTGDLLDTIPPITIPATSSWVNRGPIDISAGAGMNVYLEFRFQGTSDSYIGVYIDDVKITATTP